MNNLKDKTKEQELNDEELDTVAGGAAYIKNTLAVSEKTVSVGRLGAVNKFDDTGNLTKPRNNFGVSKAHY